jgi:transcriptional regulator with XRE-family HTH domain
MLDTKIIGKNIATYRKMRCYTQDELADKLMVTAQAVSRWENGHTLPETILLPRLAGLLHISIDELLSDQLGIKKDVMITEELEKVQKKWDEYSDSWYLRYRCDETINKIIDDPSSAFHHTVWEKIISIFSSLKGKRICVPSSGDNHAVFAFAILGAKVTSCDISQRQLENAEKIANKYGWDIEFICDDTMHLNKLQSELFDFVYTSNGVHVWISDLNAMYRNIYRILKKSGNSLVYEIHPFCRPFDDSEMKLKIIKPYDWTGPFIDGQDGIPRYGWRIQDICNAIFESGLSIRHMEEMFAEYGTYWFCHREDEYYIPKEEKDKYADWKVNPYAALPQWMMLHLVK